MSTSSVRGNFVGGSKTFSFSVFLSAFLFLPFEFSPEPEFHRFDTKVGNFWASERMTFLRLQLLKGI